MRLAFSDALFVQVVEECLVSAGELGKLALSHIDWPAGTYDVLDIPAADFSGAARFDKHVVPHRHGTGTFEAPGNVDCLVDWLQNRGLSLIVRDFALRKPHQHARKDRSIVLSEEVYYYFQSTSDDEHDLKRVITIAQSWTFLGMAAEAVPLTPLQQGRFDECVRGITTFVFSIFAGDTFLAVDVPRSR